MQDMPAPKRMTAYRASALMLILLGVGNFAVGLSRYNYYDTEFTTLSAAIKDPTYKDTLHLKRLRSRADFYQLVKLGGMGFLFLAGGILAFEWFSRRTAE
jgi:hypothetical protein